MSRSAKIRRFFGDGDHDFALRVGECEELQEKFDCGLMRTMARCADVDLQVMREVLRLGLIGGGMKKEAAFRLAERGVSPGDLIAAAQIASDVVEAALRGAPDEDLGERTGEVTESRTSPAGSSDTPTFTASPVSSAGASPTSAPPLSGNSAPPSRAGARPTARRTKALL